MAEWFPGVGNAWERQFDDTPGGGFTGTFDDVLGNPSQDLVDVSHDFWGTVTGSAENAGWFGEIDRALDPRSWGPGENPDWADPSETPGGLTGFTMGLAGAIGGLASDVGEGLGRSMLRNPILLVVLVVAALAFFMPYAEMIAGVTQEE